MPRATLSDLSLLEWALLKPATGNGERGTGNGERGTENGERVHSGNPYKNQNGGQKHGKGFGNQF